MPTPNTRNVVPIPPLRSLTSQISSRLSSITRVDFEKALTATLSLTSGILTISATQLLALPFQSLNNPLFKSYMSYTKQSFAVLVTYITQSFSTKTNIRVSGDKTIPRQLFRNKDGGLQCRFPDRLVLMANHQLYTDWLYLWWVAYTSNKHGHVYVIMKEALKNLPVIGWSCRLYNFIFLSRNWEKDKEHFIERLDYLDGTAPLPMWLLIFPEGTNLSATTRVKSSAWASKSNIQDMKHLLLPRQRGLQLCLQRLRNTTEWLYDCTIAYEGIPASQYGQDIFTFPRTMLQGKGPKVVNLHFRRFRVRDIPLDDDKKFEVWLRNRWREKDYLLEFFARFTRFPRDVHWMLANDSKGQSKEGRGEDKTAGGKGNGKNELAAPYIEAEIKTRDKDEIFDIVTPFVMVMMLVRGLNGKGGLGVAS